MAENFTKKIAYLKQLILTDYLKAEQEIIQYLQNSFPPIQRIQLEVELANCYWLNSKITEAEELYHKCLENAEKYDLQKEKAEVLCGLGTINGDSGRFEIASSQTQQAIAIFHQLQIPEREAYAVNRLAIIRYSQGELDEAFTLFEKVSKLVKDQDEIMAIKAINNSALIAEERGFIEEASEKYGYCTKKAKKLNYIRGILIMGNNYAGSLQLLGNYAKAESLFEELLVLAEKVGDVRNMALICQSYGGFCTDLGKLEKADQLFKQSLLFYEEIDDKLSHIVMLENYAELWLKKGDLTHAKNILLKAVEIIEKSGIHEPEINILTSLAEIHHRENNTTQAYAILKRADILAWKQKSDVARARVLIERARINISQLNLWEAELILAEAHRLAEKSKHQELKYKSLIFLAELGLLRYKENTAEISYYHEAIEYITQAMSMTSEKKLIPDYISACIVRAMLHTVKYEFKEAEELLSESMELAVSRGLSLHAQRARERLNFILNNIQNLQPTKDSDKILFSITLDEIQQIISRYTGDTTNQDDFDKIFIVSYKIDDKIGPMIHAVDNIDISDPRYIQQINLVGSLYPVSLSHGQKYNLGLFGPFPFGDSNLKALVYSMILLDPSQIGTRNKGETFFLICIIYPNEIDPLFYDQKKLESLIDLHLGRIDQVKEINGSYLHDLRIKIIEEMASQFY